MNVGTSERYCRIENQLLLKKWIWVKADRFIILKTVDNIVWKEQISVNKLAFTFTRTFLQVPVISTNFIEIFSKNVCKMYSDWSGIVYVNQHYTVPGSKLDLVWSYFVIFSPFFTIIWKNVENFKKSPSPHLKTISRQKFSRSWWSSYPQKKSW